MVTAAAIHRILAEEYHAVRALSNHGMKDLAVSPLRYWYRHINPSASPEEQGFEQKFGSALHCWILEPAALPTRYAPQLDATDHPACLTTIEDLRGYLRDKGYTPKGTRKAEIIAQVQAIEPRAEIWDVLAAAHEKEHAGKIMFPRADWDRLGRCASALQNEPKIQEFLKEGEAEVSIFLKDPDTGVPCKCRLDWLMPAGILDLKTFTQKRGKSIDRSVADAIFYEAYYRQAYWYSTLHRDATGAKGRTTPYFLAFVESEEPHEVRIKELKPASLGTANVYWQRAQLECRNFKLLWAEHMRVYGEQPWRKAQEIDPLEDEEMKALAW